MEQRNAKVMFSKNGQGLPTPRMAMSLIWLKKMGVTPEDRELLLTFDGESITIRKAPPKQG